MKTYTETLEYMYQCLPMYQRIGAAAYKADLKNTLALSKLTNHPESKFPSIHIAGTNGKGSVSHMLAAILQSAGYKTGLYTSPHLKDFRERIRINGKMIPKKKIVQFINAYQNDFNSIKPSFFEMTFALAMEYFAEQQIDIAVVETGMGGRLDSTNIVHPILTIITNIGLDHTQFLGDTLQKIAAEKAGIIKEKIPVIIGKTQQETKEIFTQKAKELNSEIFFADNEYRVENFSSALSKPYGSVCDIFSKSGKTYKNVRCGLGGIYQRENIKTIFMAFDILVKSGLQITEKALFEGLKKVTQLTGLLGRWQILSEKPLVICDTAHNTDGIQQVMNQLQTLNYKKLHIVMGMVNDKDIVKILEILPKKAIYYFCKPNIPRGLDENLLAQQAQTLGLSGQTYPSVNQAKQHALAHANNEDVVFIGGSTFVVAEAI